MNTTPSRKSAVLIPLAMLVQACGGGGGSEGGGSSGAGSPSAAPNTAAVATLSAPASAKAPWDLATPVSVTLTDGAGNRDSGPLSCSSGNATALMVANDCTSVTGLRLGSQTIQVSGANGVTATTSIRIIPPPQPIGSIGGAASSSSTHPVNVVTPLGSVLAWGEHPCRTGSGSDPAEPHSHHVAGGP